ncbi:hypothetical protein EYF80_032485 [Liparis tanakae]|uniref:Uncharacterized protein n=1 Tax=Liparis tanakae TaxID=230148 RepID=A0A4Z2GUV1_9TELE|nr:hypothetical protein EYF80_032485 [Liparis tanakae]
MTAPSQEELIQKDVRFHRADTLPRVIGRADGNHVPTVPPRDGHRDLVGRTMFSHPVPVGPSSYESPTLDLNMKPVGAQTGREVLRFTKGHARVFLQPWSSAARKKRRPGPQCLRGL